MSKKVTIVALSGVVVIVLLVLIVMAANNKDTANDTGTTNNTSTSTSTDSNNDAADEKPAEAADKVTIQDSGFSPANITVKKGTTVTWTNSGDLPHTVTSSDESGPKSATLQAGETYTFTFNTAGTFNYICDLHPSMKGMVTVTE
ncbi:MAG TPA: cupredoxin domain-containing protein [Candidatus Saccharimonadales bacterium]|nr:cupredoxin domain-containing protein [Candidatus Saccharimonadales bacterium]